MARRMMVIMMCLAVAVLMSGVPQLSFAETSYEKEEKEEKKKKEKKSKTGDKGKSGSNPVDGVNKVFDEFKKGSGAAKDDARKTKNTVNDSWQKSK